MKVKGFISIFIVFAGLLLNSCDYHFQPEEYYFSDIASTEELENAVDGVEDYFLYFIQDYMFQNSDLLGDDQVTTLRGEPLYPHNIEPYAGYYNLSGKIKGFKSFQVYLFDWKYLFSTIASINNILSQFDLASIKDKKTEVLLGEMVFYRAYLHYRLMLIYGRIPIIDNNEVNYTLPRSSFPEIYLFIEKELKLAIQMLPTNKSLARIPNESPDRGCAKALLGEVYLSWAGYPTEDKSKYELAASTTKDVIDSSSFYNYELLPDFEDVWNKKYQFANEAVFCRYINDRNKSFSRYKGGYHSLHSTPPTGFGFDGKYRLTLANNPVPEIQFYNNYPMNYRKDVTFFTRIYVDSMSLYYSRFGNPTGINPLIEAGLDTGYFDITFTDSRSRAAYKKFFVDTLMESTLLGTPKLYLIRYAQTLLTYAEASARSGKLDEKSYECVNRIRRRANKLPLNEPSPYDLPQGLSPDAFADSVVQERAWELAGEIGHRWFDMVRTQTVEKVFDNKDPNDGGPFKYSDNDKYFFPIPEGDINLNPKLGN